MKMTCPISRRLFVTGSASLLLLLSALVAGCTGARSQVTFDESDFPISLTDRVPDADGRILAPGDQEVLGSFSSSGRSWSLFWSLLSLNDIDFSDELNQQVRAAGGEAVVNLRVTTALPFWPDVIPNLLLLHWVPVVPGSVTVSVEGDIIRSRRSLSRADESSGAGRRTP